MAEPDTIVFNHEIPDTIVLNNEIPDQENAIVFQNEKTGEMLKIDSMGFHYNGQVIRDAGYAHQLFCQWLIEAQS